MEYFDSFYAECQVEYNLLLFVGEGGKEKNDNGIKTDIKCR